MAYTATISSKGQVVIPAKLRKELGLKAGGRIVFTRDKNKLVISTVDWDAVFALCGKYEGLFSEDEWLEEKRIEREREDRELAGE